MREPSFKIRLYQLDSHAHFDLYSNEDGPQYSHSRASVNGPVCLRRAEFSAFVGRLDAGVATMPWPGRDEPVAGLEEVWNEMQREEGLWHG